MHSPGAAAPPSGKPMSSLPAGQFHQVHTGFTPEEWGNLHPAFKEAINMSPMVRELKMSPAAVFSHAKIQQKPGEAFEDSLNRLSRDVGRSLLGPQSGGAAIKAAPSVNPDLVRTGK